MQIRSGRQQEKVAFQPCLADKIVAAVAQSGIFWLFNDG